ncbi:uncharacterized protein METZ01_LOCUS202036 [marine metagenome]|uniref:Uncharacterized protein n=1 Tax=marine metagenome TaxID=408172 RepID=A0A382EFS4_9ZZZZ
MDASFMKKDIVMNVAVSSLSKHGGEAKTAQLINGQTSKTVYT